MADIRSPIDILHCRKSEVHEASRCWFGYAHLLIYARLMSPTAQSASQIISSSKRHTPSHRKDVSGIQRLFSFNPKRVKQQHASYRPTYDKVPDGPDCRIYGSVEVKKVTANLHVTTLGHGYMSFEHTDHHCK